MPGNINTLPLWQLETWPAPNYDNPVRRTWMPAYSITLQAFSTILVATRLWLRATNQAGRIGIDDWLLIPTLLTAIGFTACSVIHTQHGGDRHIWDVPYTEFQPAILNAWVSQVIYLVSTTCVKVSVLLFFRRLVAGTYSKRWKYATIGAILFTIGYCVAFVLILIFGCKPTEAYWRTYDPVYLASAEWWCLDARTANLVAGVLSVVTDFYSVLLPCLMLRRFDAPRRQKVALNVVFCFGLLVVAAGAVRTYYFNGLAYSLDETWLGFDIYVWAQLELQLAIICASAPALRVFFRRYLSDPFNRAINTAKTHSSAMRSGNRNSHTLEHGTIHYPSNHSRGMSDVIHPEHYNNINDYPSDVKPKYQQAYTKLDEPPALPPPPRSPLSYSEKSHAIRTPADFENYALANLERNRPFTRPAYQRPASETSNYAVDEPPAMPRYIPR